MLLGHASRVQQLIRIAERGELAHGYIFFGPPRVGKKTSALYLARLFETNDPESRQTLGDCFLVTHGEISSIGIDSARNIKEFLMQRPNRSAYRTVIIDDAEFLTDEAQNALLKISEEAPASSLIILVARDPGVLRETLRSRFQKLYFAPVPEKDIAAWLINEKECPKKEAERFARASYGAPGRAYALYGDKRYQALARMAQAFFAASAAERRTLVKKLVADDAWGAALFAETVEALIECAANDTERHHAFLKAALSLRRNIAFISMNPRLQLEALSLHRYGTISSGT